MKKSFLIFLLLIANGVVNAQEKNDDTAVLYLTVSAESANVLAKVAIEKATLSEDSQIIVGNTHEDKDNLPTTIHSPKKAVTLGEYVLSEKIIDSVYLEKNVSPLKNME